MTTPEREIQVHGVHAAIPDTWEDHTVYRFAAPARPLPEDFLKLGEKGAVLQRFRPNLIVAAFQLKTPGQFQGIFQAQNEADKERHADFKVVRSGSCRYLGQDATWQDCTFVDERLNFQVWQRQIALLPKPHRLVAFTLTCDAEADLESLARELSFDSTSPGEAPR